MDVTTIGATFVYGFVCASTIHVAKSREDRLELWCGRVGLAVMVVFGLNLLLPSLFINSSREQESYFLFTFWGMLGFFLFQRLQSHDDESRFGQSVVVSIVLLSLILFTSIAWINQASLESAANMIGSIRAFLRGDAPAWAREMSEDAFIAREMRSFQNVYTFNTVIIVSLFAFALYTWFRSFAKMRMRAVESEVALNNVKSIAYADPLTGVRSKHAYTDRERNLNELIADGLVGSFALVICDINGLKQVNDTRGHKAGDEYIRSASEMICELYAHSPVFRVGGDEFVVILMGGDYEHRQEILDELNRRCEHNIAAGKVVVAAGMSEYRPRMDRSVRDVFERADSRMYARKQELKQMGSVSR